MKEEIEAMFEIDKVKALCDKIGNPELFFEYLECRGTLEHELFLIKLESFVKSWVDKNP